MKKQLNENSLRILIRQLIEEKSNSKKIVKEQSPDQPKAEGSQSWFTGVNVTRVLQNKLGRELANNKETRMAFSNVLSDLIKKRFAYPEVQSLMSFIEKYK